MPNSSPKKTLLQSLLCLAFWFVVAVSAEAQESEIDDGSEPELRTWTDDSGKYRVEATMLGFTGGKVQLRKADGTLSTVPMGRLSKEDQQYVRRELARRREKTSAVRRREPAQPDDGWPGWRGPNRDGKSSDRGLLDRWPNGGPTLLWKASGIGHGFSSVAVSQQTVYITGDIDNKLAISALDLDGKRQWQVPVDAAWTQSHPGSRATPTIDGDRVYLLSGNGVLACLDAADGRRRWARNAAEFGGRPGGWGYAESVLIYGDLAVFKPGGRNGIVALDKRTGTPVWTSSGFDAGPEYSSSIVATWQGSPMIITGTRKGIVAVDAGNGRLLWADPFSSDNTANCPTPAFADGYVFWANGYGQGGVCLRLETKGGRVTAERAWTTNDMDCHHGGYIIHEGYIYGNHKNGWTCLDLKTGQKQWEERAVGKGSLCFADEMLYLFGEKNGEAALATCSPDGLEVRGRVRVDGEGPSWAYPVVTGGRLYLRYGDNLYCYDLRTGR